MLSPDIQTGKRILMLAAFSLSGCAVKTTPTEQMPNTPTQQSLQPTTERSSCLPPDEINDPITEQPLKPTWFRWDTEVVSVEVARGYHIEFLVETSGQLAFRFEHTDPSNRPPVSLLTDFGKTSEGASLAMTYYSPTDEEIVVVDGTVLSFNCADGSGLFGATDLTHRQAEVDLYRYQTPSPTPETQG